MATNVFQKEAGKLLEKYFSISYRIDDASGNRYGGYSVSKKPYDFYGATKKGILWGAEVKKVKTVSFPIRNLQLHQRDGLGKLEDNDCLAFILINWRVDKKNNKAIFALFSDYTEIEYLILSNGRKSVRPADFPETWFLERVTGGWKIPKIHYLNKIL